MQTARARNNKIAVLVLIALTLICLGINAEINKTQSSFMESETSAASKTDAFLVSKNIIRNRLKSPKTADFPFNDYKYQDLGNNTFLIQSYVDAQNSYGATIRTDYTVILQYTSGEEVDPASWKVLNLSLNER